MELRGEGVEGGMVGVAQDAEGVGRLAPGPGGVPEDAGKTNLHFTTMFPVYLTM